VRQRGGGGWQEREFEFEVRVTLKGGGGERCRDLGEETGADRTRSTQILSDLSLARSLALSFFLSFFLSLSLSGLSLDAENSIYNIVNN
jgi:hypothetical protein